MKNILILIGCLCGIITTYAEAPSWGKTGHRTIGEIAMHHLTTKAKKKIKMLLEGHSPAYESIYADNIRSDDAYKKYGPWHYVNFDAGEKYTLDTANPDGDVIQAIRKCEAVLRDSDTEVEDKRFHLRMLIHLVGDLHQPLHVGHSSDRGGNDVKLVWFGEESNLHRIWDSDMIDHYQMSYTELAANLDILPKAESKKIVKGTLMDWVYETQELAEKVYDGAKGKTELRYTYMYHNWPIVETQLLKGGLRLAQILNRIYG